MNLDNIQEELFCLKFENKALADIYFRNEAERWVYSYMYDNTEKEHLDRYNFVKPIVEGKKVLDIACGCGYGSYLIATEGKAKEVLGLDLNEDSIRYGNHRFSFPTINRIAGDAQEFLEENAYDVIVSFETVEHLPKFEQFLENMGKTLAKDGKFFISTPLTKETTTNNINPYHVIEWSFTDFQNLIKKYFNIEDVYIQNVIYRNKRSLFEILFKNKNKKYKKIEFEKFSNQIDIKNIKEGYQMLVCGKK